MRAKIRSPISSAAALVFRDLHIILGAAGLMAGGDLPVHPFGGVHQLAAVPDLLGS